MLAETVSLDGGALLVALLLGLLFLVVVVGTFVAGFFLAMGAARGSGRALAGWIVVLCLEGLLCLGSLAAVVDGQFNSVVLAPIAIVVAQVVLYLRSRP